MIYFLQILFVILYVIFIIATSKNKNKKQSFKKSKSNYQKMIDRANDDINKSSKGVRFNSKIEPFEGFGKNDESNLSRKVSLEEKQSNLKKELINKLAGRKNLLKTNEEKITKFERMNKSNDLNKKIESSKIIDARSMENAIEHDDDSVYSNSLIMNCEFTHEKDDVINDKSLVKNRLKNRLSKEDLQNAIVMKEILDAPVSMR